MQLIRISAFVAFVLTGNWPMAGGPTVALPWITPCNRRVRFQQALLYSFERNNLNKLKMHPSEQ